MTEKMGEWCFLERGCILRGRHSIESLICVANFFNFCPENFFFLFPVLLLLFFFTKWLNTRLTLKMHLISPYNISSESHIKVMRIKEMVTREGTFG